jgi:hypothetical protein
MTPTNSSSDYRNPILQAQYQGLREEIVSRTNAAIQILAFTLVAFGTILTIAYSGNSGGIGNLILFYNVVAVFSLLIYLSNKVAIYAIGRFLRDTHHDEWEKVAGEGLW